MIASPPSGHGGLLVHYGGEALGFGTVVGPSDVAVIMVAENGQNMIVVVPGANHRYLPADLDEAALTGADYVLLQIETPMETVIAASDAARRHGVQVILHPTPVTRSPSSQAIYKYRYFDTK